MAKSNTSGKKPFALHPDRDDTDASDASLYGHVTALNSLETANTHTIKAHSSPAFTTSSSTESFESAPGRFSSTTAESSLAAAPTPSAITYPSTSISKVYQHWADGDAAKGGTPGWNNNILSDGKSDYFEGEVVPHVYFYKASNNTPLINGQTYSFNVTYNYYQANTNAGGFVYMTSPNADRVPTSFAGGDAQADSTFTNGGGMQGSFNTVNANITAVSGVTYDGDPGSSLSGKVTVTFVYTGPNTTSGGAEIQYGLMIAAPGDVPDQGHGMTDGANAWTGGSLQTTVDIGGSGATSIQLAPSAIIVGEISGMKFSDIDGNGARDADGADNQMGTSDDEAGLGNWKIFLDLDNDGQWDIGEAFDMTDADGKYALSVIPDSDRSDPDNDPYIVREVQQAGWTQTTVNPAPIVITALDPKETNVDFGNMQLKPSLNIVKDASVPGGTADAAGDIITYSIAVQNTGNQTLTGVTVTDPFISNLLRVEDGATVDNELDVGETWSYTASHVVTQAEIDAGTPIVNVATADSNQTGPDTDDASITVEQAPGLNIVKDAMVAGGTANMAGEVIAYAISVQNTGNQTLTGVTVADPFISNLLRVEDGATADNELDVGETWHYTASHVVTQAEIDAGTPIVNVATADSNQTGPDTDDASVMVQQDPDIALDKAIEIITQGNGNTIADAAGDVLNYTVTVFNRGNVTLTDVTITDVLTGLIIEGVTLAPGESRTYEASYVLTQQDLDTNGGGDGYIENTATADSAQTGAVSDAEHILVRPRASLGLDKVFVGVTDGNDNTRVDAAGDVLHYTATVTNEGNVTLTGVSVMDPTTGLNQTGLTLAPGESAVYKSTYTLTQIDVDSNGDGDGYHDNIAMADSDQTGLLSDAESTPLLRTTGLGVEKNVASITGGNNNNFADQAGESINYTINVYNAGTVTLTNVTVLDDLTGLSETIDVLAPGDHQVYLTSYTLTQADLDNTGIGSGYIDNATVVDSDQTSPTFDNEMVQLIRSSVLYFDKAFLNVTGGNGNNLVDAAGDVLNYRIVVANPSNMTLTGVSIAEPLTGLFINDQTLAPGQSQTYLTSYTLTQADIDTHGGGDGYIDNIAVADSTQTVAISDIESVPVLRSIGMNFNKGLVNIDGGNGNTLADAAGDMLNYVFTVSNPGSVTLTNLTVVDDLTGMSKLLASLAPGATVTYHSSYMLTQADLDSNAGGDGVLINTAAADTNETPVFTDSEGVNVVYQPIIDLTKYVSVDNGSSWVDANGPTGPLLSSSTGFDPKFKYTVTNSGNITLADVTLTDAVYDLNGAEAGTAYSFGTLAVGASMDFIFTQAAWAAGQQSGDATVTVAGMPSVLDIDNAYYLGV